MEQAARNPTISASSGKGLANRVAALRATQAGLIALCWLALAATLPLNRLGTWPLLRGDYSYHYAQVMEVNELLAEQGSAWGYSDRFAAGSLIGVGSNMSSRVWALFVYLLSQVSVPATLAFNLYPAVWLFSTPLLIYHACRRFSLPPPQATAATTVAMAYWWTSALYWYFRCGLLSFLASMPLGMFAIATLYAFASERRWRWLPAFGLTTALCGWIHPLSAVFIVPGGVAVYLTRLRKLTLAQHIGLFAVCALVLTAQWPWVAPLLETRNWLPASPVHLPYWQALGEANLSTGLSDRLARLAPAAAACLAGATLAAYLWRRDRPAAVLFLAGPCLLFIAAVLLQTPLHRLLLLGGWAGLAIWWRSGRRALVLVYAAVIVSLLYLGYLGTSFASLQPGRNVGVAYLWLAVPTAAAGQRIAHHLRERRMGRSIGSVAAVLLALSLWPIMEPGVQERWRVESPSAIQPPSKELTRLEEWLTTRTTTDGRILFEDSLVLPSDYNMTAGYLAYASDRAFIGGPFPWGGPVDFIAASPFLRPIASITGPEMAQLFDLYNIHWVIVHTDASRAYFDAHPELVESLDDLGFVRTYRVRRPATYFLAGNGHVTVRSHMLELSALEGSTIIVKYHWVPGLEATSGVHLERADAPPDPYGFIKIIDPPDHITIQLPIPKDLPIRQ